MTTDHIKMLQATVDKSRATIHDDGTVSIGKPVSNGEIILKPSNGTEVLRITNTYIDLGYVYRYVFRNL